MIAKPISIKLKLECPGAMKVASLAGFAYFKSGFLAGRFDADADLSDDELTIMSMFTFTGCPIAARTSDPSLNPWIDTEGTYRSKRQLRSDEFSADAELIAVASPEQIAMELSINLHGSIPRGITIAEPFQERIYQERRGHLKGIFNAVVRDRNGNAIPVVATSKYELAIARDAEPVWRNITILNQASTDGFMQIEQIDLFGTQSVAESDLKEKRAIAIAR